MVNYRQLWNVDLLWVTADKKVERQIPATSDHTCACHDGARFRLKRCKASTSSTPRQIQADAGAKGRTRTEEA
jgi:hypothetical protein